MTVQITPEDIVNINKLSIAAVDVPPGSMFQTYFVNEMINGKTIADIAFELTSSTNFTKNLYPEADNAIFATKFIANLTAGYAPNNGADAVDYVKGLLDSGMSRADVVLTVANDIGAADNSSVRWGDAADLFHNRVILSIYYSGNPAHATDVDGMHRAMSLITPDPNSILTAEAGIDVPSTIVSITGSTTAVEGDNAIFTVKRVGDLSVTTTVDFNITSANGADNHDYHIPSGSISGLSENVSKAGGTLVFPAFISTASFIVPISNDKLAENGEQLIVTLANNAKDTFSQLDGKFNSFTTTLLDHAKGITLKGDAEANVLNGGNGNDKIIAMSGNDTLYGGEGKDILRGGFGDDVFKYLSVTEGGDTIFGFGEGDVLQFAPGSLGTLTNITNDNLLIGENKISAEQPSQYFMYDTTTHNLYFDGDGNGGLFFSTLIAHFSNDIALSASNFFIG